MQLELTTRQAEALLTALATFDDSYTGYEGQILPTTKTDLRLCETISRKIVDELVAINDRQMERQARRDELAQ